MKSDFEKGRIYSGKGESFDEFVYLTAKLHDSNLLWFTRANPDELVTKYDMGENSEVVYITSRGEEHTSIKPSSITKISTKISDFSSKEGGIINFSDGVYEYLMDWNGEKSMRNMFMSAYDKINKDRTTSIAINVDRDAIGEQNYKMMKRSNRIIEVIKAEKALKEMRDALKEKLKL